MGQNLSQEELEYISHESGIEDDIIKSWHKDFIKICPTGKMDKKQFYKFYRILRGNPAEEENLAKITDHVFKCFDKDQNGSLSFAEFIIAYSSTSNSDIVKKLEFVFLFYDSNRDGFITDKEITRGVEIMYEFRGLNKSEYPPEHFVKDIFKKMDKDGDKKLSKQEFIRECMSNKRVLSLLSPFDFEY